MYEYSKFAVRLEFDGVSWTVYKGNGKDLVSGVRLIGLGHEMSDGNTYVEFGRPDPNGFLGLLSDDDGSAPGGDIRSEGLEVLREENERLKKSLIDAQLREAQKDAVIEELRTDRERVVTRLLDLAERGLSVDSTKKVQRGDRRVAKKEVGTGTTG